MKDRPTPTYSTPADPRNYTGKDFTGGRRAHHDSKKTTLMLRNLPNDYNREMFLNLVDAEGLAGSYDFVYFPVDFKTGSGLGYAFMNFTSHEAAVCAWQSLKGYNSWLVPSVKSCDA